MPFIVNRENLAWAAGYYEGEGSCHQIYGSYMYRGERRNRKTPQYILQIGSTDLQPLQRFQEAVGVGTIYGPYQYGKSYWKEHWKYNANGFESVQAALAMIWPWLSPRRQEQVCVCLGKLYIHA